MTGWIATFGAPRGHRVRFLYGSYTDGNGAFHGIDTRVRTIECECGWKLTYPEQSRQHALEQHARHCADQRAAAGSSIGERDAAAELVERAASDELERLAELPHPAELEREEKP